MGKKIRAAKASLVAAFVAAGGATAAKAEPTSSAASGETIEAVSAVSWGDQLIRFLKLDGFPAYMKIDEFAQLGQFYKEQLVSDAATLYDKWPDQVSDLLSLYIKGDAGPLAGILIGLEQYNKDQNIEPLLDYLKTPGAMDAYVKFESFFSALQHDAREGAFQFFWKETGIAVVPAVQFGD